MTKPLSRLTTVAPRVLALTLALGLGACANSSYQSARMLEPGTNRLTAAVTSYSAYVDEGNSGESAFEIIGSHGLSDKLEVGGKLSYMDVDTGFGGGTALTALFVPKYSLTADKLALVVPVGAVLVEDTNDALDAYQVSPGVVYTRPLVPNVELDLAGQVVVAMNSELDDSEIYLGGNVGVAVSPGGAPWALHPELGLLIPTGDAADTVDYFLHFGLAFHYRFGGAQTP